MSEWLGKPRLQEEDIRSSQPSLVKYFPMLTRFYVDDQKMRVIVILSHEAAEKFKAAVTKTYGFFGPTTINKAASEALEQWIQKNV